MRPADRDFKNLIRRFNEQANEGGDYFTPYEVLVLAYLIYTDDNGSEQKS